MNNRLKQIAYKANPSSEQIYSVLESWPYNCAAWSGEEVGKFAELLIDDIITQINTYSMMNVPPTTIAQVLKKTYGF